MITKGIVNCNQKNTAIIYEKKPCFSIVVLHKQRKLQSRVQNFFFLFSGVLNIYITPAVISETLTKNPHSFQMIAVNSRG